MPSLSVMITRAQVQPPSGPTLYRHKHDVELGGVREIVIQTGDGRPQVFLFNKIDDGPPVSITEQWQYYIRAINYGMTVQHVAALFGTFKAYCNGTGTGNAAKPRADYLLGEALDSPPPSFDKARTNGGSVMTGVVQGATLAVRLFDGNQPPPLKAGRRYPSSVSQINLDDYLYNPQYDRPLFLVCNNVQPDGRVTPFAHGAIYPWTGDGRPYTFLPHVARVPLSYSLENLVRVDSIPSPYLDVVK